MSENKMAVLIVSIVLCVVLFLVGGFVFGTTFTGMICVIFGIAIGGLGAGNFMNSPCPSEQSES